MIEEENKVEGEQTEETPVTPEEGTENPSVETPVEEAPVAPTEEAPVE